MKKFSKNTEVQRAGCSAPYMEYTFCPFTGKTSAVCTGLCPVVAPLLALSGAQLLLQRLDVAAASAPPLHLHSNTRH